MLYLYSAYNQSSNQKYFTSFNTFFVEFTGRCSGEVWLSNEINTTHPLILSSSVVGLERFSLRYNYNKRKSKGITKNAYKFNTEKVYGNCCWRVWSRFKGGRPFGLSGVSTVATRWIIRAVEVVRNCNFEWDNWSLWLFSWLTTNNSNYCNNIV